jgi:hypothetical protein
MSDKPSRWDFIAEAKAIRDGRTEAPEPGSPSAELAAELGAERGDDPINDRADEAAQWCDQIMYSEGRERLLAQYFSTDSDWLLNRLRGVIDDVVSWNPNRLLICHNSALGPERGPGYGTRFGLGLDMSEPVFNMGGVVFGVLAASPRNVAVFSSTFTPVEFHRQLKTGAAPGWYQAGGVLHKGSAARLDKTCDWRLAKNCENRRRFVLAFPLGNFIVFYVTCSPCAKELPNRI